MFRVKYQSNMRISYLILKKRVKAFVGFAQINLMNANRYVMQKHAEIKASKRFS